MELREENRDRRPPADEPWTEGSSPWLPTWMTRLGVPAWLVDPQGILRYLNDHAETVLGCSREEVLGTPCHLLVGAVDEAGRPVCGADCSVRAAARRDEALPLILGFRARRTRGAEWIQILCIPLVAPDGSRPWVVHLATDIGRTRRMQSYLEGALVRGAALPGRRRPSDLLTPREVEILALLAENLDQKRIAHRLSVSYVTVRNHVQHILRKLEAHSIGEAVALWLLAEDDLGPAARE